MRLFDTHGHLADAAFDPDRAAVLERMRAAGVRRAVVVGDPCDDPPSAEAALALAEAHDFLYAAVGVHPHNASGYGDAVEARLLSWMARPKCRLWGEIGLDYHYDLSPRAVQREVFAAPARPRLRAGQARAAAHPRGARRLHGPCSSARPPRGGCPPASCTAIPAAGRRPKRYLDWGLYISLSGAVTFKNAPKLAEVAARRSRRPPADRDRLPVHGARAAARAAQRAGVHGSHLREGGAAAAGAARGAGAAAVGKRLPRAGFARSGAFR